MTLINEDQINGEFQSLKLGVAPFATIGNLRFGPTGQIYIRDNADVFDLLVVSHSGPDPDFDDEILFANVFAVRNPAGNPAGVGQSANIKAGDVTEAEEIPGYINLIAGNGIDQGGDILLVAGNASESGVEGAGGVTILAGNGVDAGGAFGIFAGNASEDSTAGAGVEIGSGIGKGAPVSSIQFFTAGSEAGASDAQTSNLRGTMSDEVFTWDGVLKLTPRAFADLPATPEEGMMAWITDSDGDAWGDAVTGGGANKRGIVFNGTTWTVFAK